MPEGKKKVGRPKGSKNKPKKNDNWLQSAETEMQKEGTEGKFTEKARRAGKSVSAYANEVITKYKGKTKTPAQLKLLREAVFAKNAQKFRK